MNNGRKKILKGSAFVYGLVILTAVAIVLTSIIGFVVGQTKYAMRTHAREQAFQIADSGIQFYKWYLAHNTDGRTAQQIQDFWENGDPYGVGDPYEAEYIDPSGGAVGKYRLEVTPPEQGSTAITVISTGWSYKYPNDLRVIEVRFRRPSWSEYAVLANGVIGFGSGTETFGKIHANSGVRFNGIANNVVTSAVVDYDDPDHTGGNEFGVHTHMSPVDPLPPAAVPARTDIFKGGRQFPVSTVDFNGVLGDLNYIKSVAVAGTDGSIYFDNTGQGRHIVFNGTTFNVCTVQSFNANTNQIINYSGSCTNNLDIPNNGVIFVEGNVWLQGNLSGRRVTIVAANLISASQKSVYLGMGNITYSDYDGTDVLGVIAQKDVAFVKNSLDTLQVDGALLAQSGRFGFWFRNGSGQARACIQNSCGSCNAVCVNACIKTSITLNGAIATNERYALYLGDACVGASGYPDRNINYDNNLLYYPPPYFPVGTQYEMDLWEEK